MPLLHPTYKNRHNYQMLKTFLRETRGEKKAKKEATILLPGSF